MTKTSPPELFSAKRIISKLHRARKINKADADFLEKIAADMLFERLGATNREFPVAVNLFSRSSQLLKILEQSDKVDDVISLTWHTDNGEQGGNNLSGVPEALPFKPESLNLVASLFGLHWSNDLPGTLSQIHKALKPDGLFLGVFPGDRTLTELRECLIEAESQLSDAISLRVEPFGEVRQFGALLQRAGFALPVVDTEVLTARYKSLQSLVDDLRAMGVTSSLVDYPGFGPRELFQRTEEIYQKRYCDPDGKITVTFELIFVSGWTPHESQQSPLAPGSAKHQLKDYL